MDLTPQNVRALKTNVYQDFRRAYDTTPIAYPRFATTVNSTTAQNDYAWMAQLPELREWVGPRVVENLKTHNYTLVNKTWEATLGVKREHIEDDNLSIYAPIAGSYGESTRKHPDTLMGSLLLNGQSNLCWDGQYFYDTDHPVSLEDPGKGQFQNYWASGMALTAANYETVYNAMCTFKGENGQPLGIVPDLLVVPPQLRFAAHRITKIDTDAAGAGNPYFGTADYIVLPELASQPTAWHLLCAGRMIKPFVFQSRRPLAFKNKDGQNDEVVIVENELRFYADARYNAGYTLPFLAAKAVA